MIYVLGGITILLGLKGFTPSGLPLTRGKNVTGFPAMVIGVFCLLVGIGICVFGAVGDAVLSAGH